jgi:hypothetical protein
VRSYGMWMHGIADDYGDGRRVSLLCQRAIISHKLQPVKSVVKRT